MACSLHLSLNAEKFVSEEELQLALSICEATTEGPSETKPHFSLVLLLIYIRSVSRSE
jgi:hypothetical protein